MTAPAASASDFLGEAGRRFGRFTGSRAWQFSVDLYPVLVAASLPWSTSAVLIFMSIWFIALIPTIEPARFFRALRAPSSLAPIALFGVAIIGMLWADGTWRASLLGLGPVAKLLVLPFLLYHFERSTPRALGVLGVPDLVQPVAGLLLDRLLRAGLAVQGGARLRHHRRAGPQRHRPEPGIRAVRTRPRGRGGRRIPETTICGCDRARRSRRGIPVQRVLRGAVAHVAGLYRADGADLCGGAFRPADDIAGSRRE